MKAKDILKPLFEKRSPESISNHKKAMEVIQKRYQKIFKPEKIKITFPPRITLNHIIKDYANGFKEHKYMKK